MKPVDHHPNLLSTSAAAIARAAPSPFLDTILPADLIEQGLQLDRFRITVRQTDWRSWAFGAPLRLDDHWVQAILDMPALAKVKEFRLELETAIGWKRLQDPIAKRLRRLKGRPTLTDPTPPSSAPSTTPFVPSDKVKEWRWTRPATIGSGPYAKTFKGVKSIELCVEELVWHRKPCRLDKTAITPIPTSLDAFLDDPARSSARSPADSPFRRRPRTEILYNGRYPYDAPLDAPQEDLWFSDGSHEDGSQKIKTRRRRKRRHPHAQDWLALPVLRMRRSVIWDDTVQRAEQGEGDRRTRFEAMVAEFWVETLTREWEARGSLLRLERMDG